MSIRSITIYKTQISDGELVTGIIQIITLINYSSEIRYLLTSTPNNILLWNNELKMHVIFKQNKKFKKQ